MDIYVNNEKGNLCFSPDFFQYCLSEVFNDPSLKIISATEITTATATEIEKAKYTNNKLTGLFKYHVVFEHHKKQQQISLLVKSKISNKEFIELATSTLLKAGVQLEKSVFAHYLEKTSLGNGDEREIKIYQTALKNSALKEFFPGIYGTYINQEKNEYIILEELLKDAYIIQDYQDISFWNNKNIISAVQDLAKFHSVYYEKPIILAEMNWLGGIASTHDMIALTPLWQAYAENLFNLLSKEDIKQHFHLIETLPIWRKQLEVMPKTLIYNDIQIRNLAMRPIKDSWKLCLFDWEVATTHIPQRDLVEFLSYVIKADVTDQEIMLYLNESRIALEKATDKAIDQSQWLHGCLLALYDYQIERLSVQLIFNKIINRHDIERVWQSSRRLLAILKEQVSQ